MDADDSSFSSYYHHHHHHHPAAAPVNGIFSPSSTADAGPLLFPRSLSGRASAAPAPVPTEPVRRKRGRPRKYGPSPTHSHSPSISTSPSVKNISASAQPLDSSSRKKENPSSSSSKKAQLGALGNAGQGFTPHVITIAAGEDVGQKIMVFMQQCKQAVCILSASGSISHASLCQPAILGGNVTYEGRFQILSLSGSFLHMEIGGASSRPGGLSICLSGSDGRIIGGGVGGPLVAAGPVQVVICSFFIETDTDLCVSTRVDTSNKLSVPIPAGTTLASPVTIRSAADSAGRITTSRGTDDHLNIGGIESNYILQSGMPSRSRTDWIGGKHDGGGCLSPEVEEHERIRD